MAPDATRRHMHIKPPAPVHNHQRWPVATSNHSKWVARPPQNTLLIPFLRSSLIPTSKMPVTHSTPSVLSLLPSLELEGTQIYPVEREVHRNAVLDVAPDREYLLINDQTMEEVRQALKIHTSITTGYVLLFYCYQPSHLRCGISRHWLYNTQNARWSSYAKRRHIFLSLANHC